MNREARFWRKDDQGAIHCDLCPHRCRIAEGRTGLCKVRGVLGGELKALGYGKISSAHVDPIEKKPLYHFHPGSEIFSIGGWGCNLKCEFCQNWTISQQFMSDGDVLEPSRVVDEAGTDGSTGIAYTYNEPMVGFEFVIDCSKLARRAGLANVLVTNGFINPEPARELLEFADAANVDIKSMDDAFYRQRCGGRLDPVLEFCKMAVAAGCWVEITNLVIPTLNDEIGKIRNLASWIAENLGKHVPLHLSAYYPQYKCAIPPTNPDTLAKAHEACSSMLSYVYVGNVGGGVGQNSICPACGNLLISRSGYSVEIRGMKNSMCSKCGRRMEGVF